MLFLSNRKIKQNPHSTRKRKICFDMKENSPSNSVYFCERSTKDNYTEIGSFELMQKLKNSKYKQILIYIHGFSCLPERDVFPVTEQLQKLFNLKEKNLVEVIPLIWPCDNDLGLIKDYWDDQKSADQSAFAFARVLEKFMEWRSSSKHNPPDNQCLKRVNILAHSMGNRVLRETLRIWNKYDLASGVPILFRNVYLVAADIVNESLEKGKTGELICNASRNVIVYHASDDLALRASKVSNLKNKIASRRLGHTGPEDISKTPNNVYSVDCDNVNTKYDIPAGHSCFLRDNHKKPGVVFEHIFSIIKSGRVFPNDLDKRTTILK